MEVTIRGLIVKMFKEGDPKGANAISARATLGPKWQEKRSKSKRRDDLLTCKKTLALKGHQQTSQSAWNDRPAPPARNGDVAMFQGSLHLWQRNSSVNCVRTMGVPRPAREQGRTTKKRTP
mgnify:CR=1 FL=1